MKQLTLLIGIFAGIAFSSCDSTPNSRYETRSLVGRWGITPSYNYVAEITENSIVFVFGADLGTWNYRWIDGDNIEITRPDNYTTRNKVIFHTPDSVTVKDFYMSGEDAVLVRGQEPQPETPSLAGRWEITSGRNTGVDNSIVDVAENIIVFITGDDLGTWNYRWIDGDSIEITRPDSYATRNKVIFHTPDSVTVENFCMSGYMIHPPTYENAVLVRGQTPPRQSVLVGKWYTTDYNSNHNDTIIFTADGRVENYFIFTHSAMYPESAYYFTYSTSADGITFTYHRPEGNAISETYRVLIQDNHIMILGFSNPFSATDEGRTDVTFHRCIEPINPGLVLGTWHLTGVSAGFAGMFYWPRGWVTYKFKDNPKIVSVYVSENVTTVNQPFFAPIAKSGDYPYSIRSDINGNTIFLDSESYGYKIGFSNAGKLVLDAGMAVDGSGYFFER